MEGWFLKSKGRLLSWKVKSFSWKNCLPLSSCAQILIVLQNIVQNYYLIFTCAIKNVQFHLLSVFLVKQFSKRSSFKENPIFRQTGPLRRIVSGKSKLVLPQLTTVSHWQFCTSGVRHLWSLLKYEIIML